MRPESVLVLLQGTSKDAHPGIVDGFERLMLAGEVSRLEVLPVFGPNGAIQGEAFWAKVVDLAHSQAATLVVFAFYHSPHLPDPRAAITKLKALPTKPIVVSTLGDAFMNGYLGGPHIPRSFLQAAESSDLVALSSMGVLADYVTKFTKSPLVLCPHGVCQVRFGETPEIGDVRGADFDVVFIGSRTPSRNPFRPYRYSSLRRERLVLALERRFGNRFAVFGRGWEGRPSNRGSLAFADQAKVASAALVAVGGIPFSTERYYLSDRPFIQITSRTPLVDFAVPGVDTLLAPETHWVLSEADGYVDAVERVLEWDESVRLSFGQRAMDYVLSRHTIYHRVEMLVENARRIRLAHENPSARPLPYLPYFVDSELLKLERTLATRNWPGELSSL